MKQCRYVQIQCEYGCSQGTLLRGDIDQHKEACDKRPVTCVHCTEVMPYIGLTVSITE